MTKLTKKQEEFVATGRRKTAVASIRLRDGTGKIIINDRSFEEYFPSKFDRDNAISPLMLLERSDRHDIFIRVKGGGIRSQAESIRLGLSRASLLINSDYKKQLKSKGYLTRDPRKKERKKYGLRGARKRSQFSKR